MVRKYSVRPANLYKGRIVSNEGFKSRATAVVATGKLSQWKGSPQATVVEIVTVKASKNLKLQHISTSGLQQVPYQSLTNHQFPQGSIGFGIWFGTRGVGGSNPLSPTNIFNNLSAFLVFPSHYCRRFCRRCVPPCISTWNSSRSTRAGASGSTRRVTTRLPARKASYEFLVGQI